MNSKNLSMGLIVVALIAVAVFALGSKPTPKMAEPTPTPEQVMMKKNSYKNGTYKAEGSYTSPAQEEKVDISITLKDGVVADALFTGHGENDTTKKMQGKFSEGFKEEVVGKSIDEIALTVVNGSSLTPKGFMDALNKVKLEAQQS